MFLVVGLGNPGPEYEGTRHNVGFRVIDILADSLNITSWKKRFKGVYTEAPFAGDKIGLLKPHTFMNLSGLSVLSAFSSLRLSPENLIVVYDDSDILPGRIKISVRGGDGGHKGVRSIIQSVGGNFTRVRVGIGRPEPFVDMADFVLSRVDEPEEAEALELATRAAADAVLLIVRRGADIAMNRFNGKDFAPSSQRLNGPEDDKTIH